MTLEEIEGHALLVEERVNDIFGGDATIGEVVNLMVEMGWKPPDAINPTTLVERLNAICREYEEGGFADPGRTIDAMRDALGRR